MKNEAKEMMERLDHTRCFFWCRPTDETLRGVERSGTSMTFCHVQYNEKLTTERCSHYRELLALNHFESSVTEHLTHTSARTLKDAGYSLGTMNSISFDMAMPSLFEA